LSTQTSGAAASPRPGPDDRRTISERFNDRELMQAAMTAAFHEAIRDHLRSGRPMVFCRDGEVVKVPAEEVAAREGLL
jgi:hypothetical protein